VRAADGRGVACLRVAQRAGRQLGGPGAIWAHAGQLRERQGEAAGFRHDQQDPVAGLQAGRTASSITKMLAAPVLPAECRLVNQRSSSGG
jgi:hypothetical protein